MQVRKVLVAVDGSEESMEALDAAIEIGRDRSSELFLLCVARLESFPDSIRAIAELRLSDLDTDDRRWPNLTGVPLWMSDAMAAIRTQGSHQKVIDELASQILSRAKGRAESAGIVCKELSHDSGDPTAQILGKCEVHGIDLVVLAPHHEASDGSPGDSVTLDVVRKSPCSCLVYKSQANGG